MFRRQSTNLIVDKQLDTDTDSDNDISDQDVDFEASLHTKDQINHDLNEGDHGF